MSVFQYEDFNGSYVTSSTDVRSQTIIEWVRKSMKNECGSGENRSEPS